MAYNVTVSTNSTSSGAFSNGTFTPTGDDAVIQNSDIPSGSSTTITTGSGGTQNGDITITAGIDAGSGTLALNAHGQITETTGTITSSTLTGSTNGFAYLGSTGNAITTLGAFTTSGGAFSLTNGQALSVSGSVATGNGNLNITVSTGAQTVAGDLNAGTGSLALTADTITQTAGTIIAGHATLSAGTITVGSNVSTSVDLTFNTTNAATDTGVISGAGSLTLKGGGTLTLNAANTYSGGTVISAGTLELSHATTLSGQSVTSAAAGTGAVSFTDGGAQTLRLAQATLGADAGHTFANTIASFGTDGDVIDVRGIGQNAVARFDGGSNTLTLTDAGNTATYATLHLTGSYANKAFTAVSDGVDGSQITVRDVTAAPVVAAPANGAYAGTETPTYSGTAATGSTVTVYVDGQSIGTTTATNGSFALTNPTTLSQGPHAVYATAVLSGQAVSAQSNTDTFTVDTVAPAAPVVTAPANGGALNTARPTFTGTAEANSTVTVYVDGSSIGTATVNGSGSYTKTQSTNLSQGSHTIYTVDTDAAGNVSSNSATTTFTVDTVAPTATVSTTSSSPTSSAAIPYTVNFSEAVTGFTASDLAVANGTVGGFSGSGATYTFTVTPTTGGTVTVSVPANDAQDAAGNGNTASNSVSVQYQQPVTAAPVVTTPANGAAIAIDHPTITGTAAANSTVTVYVDGAAAGTTTASAGGSFSFVEPATLSQGPHTVFATAQGSGQAVSANSNTDTFTVDTVAPDTTITSRPASLINTGNTTIVFTGSDGSGSGVARYQASIDGGSFVTVSSPITFSGLPDGSHTVQVRAIDQVGNIDATPAIATFTVDTTPPAAPSAPHLSAVSDTGLSSTDAITSVTTPTFTGTAEANSTVTLYDTDGTTALGSTTASGSGNWTVASATLAPGNHTLTAKAVDAAGNVSLASTSLSVVIDTQPPAVALTSQGGTVYTTTQTIAGTVTDAHAIGTTVTLTEGAATLGTAVVQANGSWTTSVSLATLGAHTITASDTDLAGNTGQAQITFNLSEPPVDPTVAGTVGIAPGQTQTLSGLTSGSLTVDGGGTLTLTGTNTYTGPTTVKAGTLLVDGSIVSPVTVQSGATLGGHGSTGTVTVASGGTLSPGNSPGILSTRDLSLASGAALKEEIGGTASGQFDQTKVVGTVALDAAVLSLASYGGFVSARGDQFVFIDNDGTDAVQGTFAGLTEGSTLALGAHTYQISYHGGDGNDVALTDVTLPPAATLALFGTVETNPASTTGALYGLYEGLLHRTPDTLGLAGFSAALKAGASLTDVAGAILASPEHGAALDATAYVQSLYANVLHRGADAGGLAFFTGELAQGVSQATVGVQMATSAEAQAAHANVFQAGVVVPDAIDSAVARLYYGVMGRAPDAGGLTAFEMQVQKLAVVEGAVGAVQGLAQVATAMLGSSEYAAGHAGQTDAAYVDSLYVGALGRHADAGGASYFAAELAQGVSKATVALQIAESPEAQVHLVGVIEQGFQLVG